MWHSDEYEYRYAAKDKWPASVNNGSKNWRGTDGEYRLRVGDFCYVIIGQIVNRQLNVIRYQPTAYIVVNSPVETPSLAAAVRTDWSGLNAEQHERSLIEDVEDSSERGFTSSAVVRLRLYYPAAAARVPVKDNADADMP